MDTTSRQIEDDARAEIAGHPRIPHPAEIAVEVVDGIATLRGTVGSFAQRHAAVADARRTKGVEYVDDWLQVRLLDRDRREDAEIRGAALQRLEWDSEIPGGIRVRRETEPPRRQTNEPPVHLSQGHRDPPRLAGDRRTADPARQGRVAARLRSERR
jgi:BON domain